MNMTRIAREERLVKWHCSCNISFDSDVSCIIFLYIICWKKKKKKFVNVLIPMDLWSCVPVYFLSLFGNVHGIC
jgi:hypothetical protein